MEMSGLLYGACEWNGIFPPPPSPLPPHNFLPLLKKWVRESYGVFGFWPLEFNTCLGMILNHLQCVATIWPSGPFRISFSIWGRPILGMQKLHSDLSAIWHSNIIFLWSPSSLFVSTRAIYSLGGWSSSWSHDKNEFQFLRKNSFPTHDPQTNVATKKSHLFQ